VSSFKPGEVVADIMAGIGPFAVPAGKHGCKVSLQQHPLRKQGQELGSRS
jgi:hypothetical protein